MASRPIRPVGDGAELAALLAGKVDAVGTVRLHEPGTVLPGTGQDGDVFVLTAV